MRSFEKTLAQVRRLHPQLGDEEAVDMAHDWLAEAAEHPVEDTPCIQDTAPAEYFTERETERPQQAPYPNIDECWIDYHRVGDADPEWSSLPVCCWGAQDGPYDVAEHYADIPSDTDADGYGRTGDWQHALFTLANEGALSYTQAITFEVNGEQWEARLAHRNNIGQLEGGAA